MKVTKHGMGGYRTGDHPSRTGPTTPVSAYREPPRSRCGRAAAASVALGPSVMDASYIPVGEPHSSNAAHRGSLAARTSAGRISGGPSRSRSCIGPVETRRSRPRGAPGVSASDGNASTIQKVVVSVRRVKGMLPCSTRVDDEAAFEMPRARCQNTNITVRTLAEQHPDAPTERVLSAVLFTDIVGSTELLSVHGDAHWRHELDAHDRLVDSLLLRYGGRRAKHTGDGVFALFDGPDQGRSLRSRTGTGPGDARHSCPRGRSHRRMRAAWRRLERHGRPCRSTYRSDGRTRRSACKSHSARPVQQARACASKALEPIASRVSRKTPRSSVSRPEQAFRFK